MWEYQNNYFNIQKADEVGDMDWLAFVNKIKAIDADTNKLKAARHTAAEKQAVKKLLLQVNK